MNASNNRTDPSFWGQLLMLGLPGLELDAGTKELIRDLKLGGVILFARNIQSPEQVWDLCRELQQEAQKAGGPPLLISVDQEGGPVQRLKEPFTIIPPARQLGLTATALEVEALARQTARELSLVGINVDLAPVLDVPRGPDCPLWERAYGKDPELVGLLGIAAIRGYRAGGVLPTAKHFPGLGDTRVDSHVDLPLSQSGDAARDTDLTPFRRAVAAGVPLVMTAHLVVPQWDSKPATLSPVILKDKLRRDLGFEGVIITDDLEMGAIATHQTAPEGARDALAAGADLLLICNNQGAAWDTVRLLSQDPALIPPAQDAARRLRTLRESLSFSTHDRGEVTAYFRQPPSARG